MAAMRPLAVFDIDGVLADVAHRLHFVESRPRRWAEFFAAADRDGLLPRGAELLGELAMDHDIRYLTGRPERLRTVTAEWLARHGLPDAWLEMRPDTDRRPSRLYKRDRLRSWLHGAEIALVVDDDPEVVAMVRQLRIPVEHATWQHTDPSGQQELWDVQEVEGRS